MSAPGEHSYQSRLVWSGSPVGLVLELLDDLVKQGRMSRAEARVVMDLVQHPSCPQELRERPGRSNFVPKTLDPDARATTPPPAPHKK